MAKVHIVNVVVLDNPCPFLNKFQFEITFECIEDLKDDLEWKIIYVGSAESEDYDQVLDTVFVGPVPEGRHMFVFEADAPDPNKIPQADVVGVTVVLLTCSYRGEEFIRIGYYVNNEYTDAELKENPPANPLFDQLTRNVLASAPRVTRFKIDWGDSSNNEQHIQSAVSSLQINSQTDPPPSQIFGDVANGAAADKANAFSHRFTNEVSEISDPDAPLKPISNNINQAVVE